MLLATLCKYLSLTSLQSKDRARQSWMCDSRAKNSTKNFVGISNKEHSRMQTNERKSTRKKQRRKIGSRAYRDYSDEMLDLAVEMVENKKMSSREAEKRFGIPRRTILNKINKLHMKPTGAPKKLDNHEEEKLASVLMASADYGSPMTKLDVKILVYKYLEKNSRTDLFNGQLPSDAWIDGFLNRHHSKLSVRATQNIKKNRAEKGLHEMEQFFDNLSESLKDVPPTNILNYDETNLADNPGTSKSVFRRGVKHPERIINSSKSSISIMFTASAAGTSLPAYVVYKAANLYSEWVEGGPYGTRYNCSKSGWFDSSCFEDYFKTVVIEWAKHTPGPKVVIGDNLSSHINIDVVELCQTHDIRLVFLPPNSTHLTQPLDVAYFGPLKKEWKKILLEYKFQNPAQTTMNKKHFPKLLARLLENIKHKECINIKSGFRATGIYPLNPRNVFKRIPEYLDDKQYGIESTLLEYLRETRAPNPMQVKRSKKLRTEPGKSVSSDDILRTTKNNETTTSKSLKSKQNTTHKKKEKEQITKCIKPNTEISRLILDSEKEDENGDSYYRLDDKTGEIIVPHTTPMTYKHNLSRLDEMCIKIINVNMGLSMQGEAQLSHNIVTLNKIMNDCQNESFIATKQSDLPECLVPQTSDAKPRVTITSNIKITDKEVGQIRKKIKIKAERIIKQSASQMIILPQPMTTDNVKNTLKPDITYDIQKDMNVLKENNGRKRKNTATGKKTLEGNNKKKRVMKLKQHILNSETSSNSCDDRMSLADTDYSDFDNFDDCIMTYLKEFGDEENFESVENIVPFGLTDIKYFTNNTNDVELKLDDWVVVKFATKKSLKHFVGRVVNLKNNIPTVKFTRKVKNSKSNKFVFTYPNVEDMCEVNRDDIEVVLPPPNISRRGQIMFDCNIDLYNIQ